MKAIFIEKSRVNEIDLIDCHFDNEFLKLMGEFKILESHIIYFSAGDSKIKEILVKKDPSYSV
jgi:Leu/Phe-tRNA-protein transferase